MQRSKVVKEYGSLNMYVEARQGTDQHAVHTSCHALLICMMQLVHSCLVSCNMHQALPASAMQRDA